MRAWRAARRSIGHHGFALGSGSAVLGGHAAFPAGAGPWWARFLLAALGLLALCLRIVFPQDSPDKLAWWRDRGRARRRRRGRAAGPRGGKCAGDRGAGEREQAPGRTSCRGPGSEFPSRLGSRS